MSDFIQSSNSGHAEARVADLESLAAQSDKIGAVRGCNPAFDCCPDERNGGFHDAD